MMSRSAYTFRRLIKIIVRFARRPSDLWLITRILAWVMVLPLLKHIFPLRKLARLMWLRPRQKRSRLERKRQVALVSGWIYNRYNHTGRCLERSLLLYRFLSEIDARPVLVAGLLKTDSGWTGHAWVVVDGVPFGESIAALEKFCPIIAFGTKGLVQSVS